VSRPNDVDSYIAGSVREARPTLETIRGVIRATIPDAEEGISWGVPFYKYHGALAGFAAYKNHVSFGSAAALATKHRELLEGSGYVTGKKTVQVKFGQDVPAGAIEQILRAQAKANEAKSRSS
jgi:uncharacterized protein YdhG (YjbR/CyaY superfamily)